MELQLKIRNINFYYEKHSNKIEINFEGYNISPQIDDIDNGHLLSITNYTPYEYKKNPVFSSIWYANENFNRLIMDNKNEEQAAEKISGIIAVFLKVNEIIKYFKPDYVIHAPIYYERIPPRWYKEKTYVEIISKEFRITSIGNLIIKDHEFSMKGKSPSERRKLAEEHFKVNKTDYDLNTKNILFIDDVITTKSTSEVISEKLQNKFNINQFLGVFAGKTQNPRFE